MKTIFNKMSVADMYIKVTQYDKMQRAFVGAIKSATAFQKFALFRSSYYSVSLLNVRRCVRA